MTDDRCCAWMGCDTPIDHLRADANYCSRTCKREAARARSGPEDANGFWAAYRQLRRHSRSTTRHALILAALVAVAMLIVGCGGQAKPVAHVPATPPAHGQTTPCPPNRSFMGCSIQAKKLQLAPRLMVPRGGLVPDVSNWQRTVGWQQVKNWQAAHRWRPAGIFKFGEYTLDTYAIRNASETRRLGMWAAGYWFVRNTGCRREASLILWAARLLGLRVVVLDMEVPEAAGYVPCLAAPLRSAGLIVVVYTAPGTWPGGGNAGAPAWIATYGVSFGCLSWTCSPVAWQFTDGTYGARTYVPGIGYDDVSVDYGITNLGTPKPQPKPHLRCFGPHASLHNTTCERVRPRVASWSQARDASTRAMRRHHCRRPYHGICGVLNQRAHWFQSQINRTLATY